MKIFLKALFVFSLFNIPAYAQAQEAGYCPVSNTNANYKDFGQSAIDDLDIDLTGDITFDPSGLNLTDTEKESNRLKALAASSLLLLSPTKKLRLATLGVASLGGLLACSDDDDIMAPIETPCTRGDAGYFSLNRSVGSTGCIKLPQVNISYIDVEGNEQTQSDDITNHSIKIKFDSVVGVLGQENWQPLTNQNISQMLEIKPTDSGPNLLKDANRWNVQIGTEGGFYVLITPNTFFQAGRYNVNVKNYATESHAAAILNSSNKANYLLETQKEFSFEAIKVDTPCTRGESGSFQLEGVNDGCIQLPQVSYTYTPRGGDESSTTNGDPTTVIRIKFDSEVMYFDESGHARNATKTELLDMLEVKAAGVSDLVRGSIGLDQLSVIHTGSGTVITIQPPNGQNYTPGNYTVLVKNYVKRQDSSKVVRSTNKSIYTLTTIRQIIFTAKRIETPCTRGESGYFQLLGIYDGCIKLPKVNYTFTPKGGAESNTPNGDPSTTIKIKFDSEIMVINSSGSFSNLTTQNVLDIVEIKLNGGADIVASNGPIGPDQVSFTSSGNTVITIQPPNGENYPPGNYTALVKNYAKKDDTAKIIQSTNKSSYFNAVIKRTSFKAINRVDTPCTRGEGGYFSLSSGPSVVCIKLPRINYTFTPRGGAESNAPNGDPTTVIRIKFDSNVRYLPPSGHARNITQAALLDMLEIRGSNGADLAITGGAIGENQVSVTHTGTGTVITIQPPGSNQYQEGSYTVQIGKFVKIENSSVVSLSTNRASYLNAIRSSSSFNIEEEEDVPTPCDRNEAGYFQLQGVSDGCIKLPQITSYTFNGSSNAVLPTGTEAVIKIEFDSEVVFFDGFGQSSLTTERVLEMLDVRHEFWSDADREFWPFLDNDFTTYYEDSISVSNTNGRTVITMKAPDIFGNGDKVHYRIFFGNYTLTVKNYVKSQDVQKVLNATNTSSYLDSIRKQKVFTVSTSCNNLEYTAPMLADEGDQEGRPFVCGNDELMQDQLELLDHLPTDPSMQAQVLSRRADPNNTYRIDVAFIVSQDALAAQSLNTWRKELEHYYIPKVNEMYQNSGVNVEFRVAAVESFSDYRRHLACSENVPSLDGLSGYDGLSILKELTPRLRRESRADLVHGILMYGADGPNGVASKRLKNSHIATAARFQTVGSTRYNAHRNVFTLTLAHELGHNLGLSHDKDTLRESEVGRGAYPDPHNWHNAGYGYGGHHSNLEIGTIMSYARHDQALSLFSANKKMSKAQICQDNVFDESDNTFPGYCSWNTAISGERIIRIGDEDANASEALQWTIEDASDYSSCTTGAVCR